MNKYTKNWIDKAHHLEGLIAAQTKIIQQLQNQVKTLMENRYTPIPENVVIGCCCCGTVSESIARCGHPFCSLCLDRYHDYDCVACEDNLRVDMENIESDICSRLQTRINSNLDNPIIKDLMQISIEEIEALRKRTKTLVQKIQNRKFEDKDG